MRVDIEDFTRKKKNKSSEKRQKDHSVIQDVIMYGQMNQRKVVSQFIINWI
jgi:hypothetical protein